MQTSLFLLVFLGMPLLVLLRLTWRQLRPKTILFVGGMAAAAMVYQFPFDYALSAAGFWWHHPAFSLGVRLGAVPLEFVVMNGLVALNSGLFMVYLWGRFSAK